MTTYELESTKTGKRISADFSTDHEALEWAEKNITKYGTAQLVRFPELQIGFAGIQRNRSRASLLAICKS